MSKKEEYVKLFKDLFEGRSESYAIKFTKDDGNKFFIPHRDREGRDLPFTEEICLKHLSGEVSLGSYPLNLDDTVRWAAIDFDGKKGDALKDAVEVKKAIEIQLGLVCWLERSQGGKGIHIWIFFDDKIKAKLVRGVIGSVIPEYNVSLEQRQTSFDRLFPHQDTTMGGYGNLCGLPLNGPELIKQEKTIFIDDSGKSFSNQWDILQQIHAQRNSAKIVENLAKSIKVPIKSKILPILQTVSGGSKLLSPVGCAWLRSAYSRAKDLSEPEWREALVQFSRIEGGEMLAQKFSEPYANYNSEEVKQKFADIVKRQSPPMLCTTLWERFGWCGKNCSPLGVTHPWELAKIPLSTLQEQNKGKVYSLKELTPVVKNTVSEIIEGKRIGFAWGYPYLDDATELRPRNLIIFAARRSQGKTAVMLDVSFMGASRGIPQYIFSKEMAHEELMLRYLSRSSEIDHSILITGKVGKAELKTINQTYANLESLPIFIDDSTNDLDKMLDTAGELVHRHGVGNIWIDYLQLIRKQNRESKKEAVDRALDSYKQMAKILEVPVIALAQLNRLEEFAEGDDDLDSWLKDSGDIEQTADVIHYLRGPLGPGTVPKRWRLHKERHRASGINFRFNLHQGIFKFESLGLWNQLAVSQEDIDVDLGLDEL